MPKGRNALTPTEIIEPDLDQERIDNAMAVMRQTESDKQLALSQQETAARAVAERLGYDGTLSVGALEDGIRFYQRRTVEALLETGKRLLLLKELTQHGEFTQRVEMLGISDRSARRFMQAAAKTAKSAKLAGLSAQIKSASAFLELVTHDDDVLENLEGLDDVDRMSASQLRAALREARAENQADKELLAEKNQLLDAERAKSKRIQTLPPDKVATELAAETAEYIGEALIKLDTSVRSAFTALTEHHAAHGGSDFRHLMAGHVAELQRRLNELRDTFHLRDIEGDGTPEWMKWSPDGTGDAPAAGE